jgi:hypothetical protein
MKGFEISSLYRSFSPKMAQYSHDGKGRDIYIGYNNGGFWSKNIKAPSSTALGDANTKFYTKFSSRNVAPFTYVSDGSGRDNYVVFENGGLKRNYKSLNEFQLKDFLRESKYDTPKFDKKRIIANYVSKAETESNNLLKQVEKQLINRLYTTQKHKFMPTKDSAKLDAQFGKTCAFGDLKKLKITVKEKPVKVRANTLTCSNDDCLPYLNTQSTKKSSEYSSSPLNTESDYVKNPVAKANNYEALRRELNEFKMKKNLSLKVKLGK